MAKYVTECLHQNNLTVSNSQLTHFRLITENDYKLWSNQRGRYERHANRTGNKERMFFYLLVKHESSQRSPSVAVNVQTVKPLINNVRQNNLKIATTNKVNIQFARFLVFSH